MKAFSAFLKSCILFNIALEISNAQVSNSLLPKPGECGQLDEKYLFNEKTVPEVGEFPWIGQISFKNVHDNSTSFVCGAVLIGRRHLLANAQCFQTFTVYEPIAVLLGQTIKTEEDCNQNPVDCVIHPGQMYEVDGIALHPNYNNRTKLHQNDIAVVSLTKDVEFNERIQPICLPPSTDTNQNIVAQYLPYVGYGDLYSVHKIKTVGHVLSPKRCGQTCADWDMIITGQHICVTCDNRHKFLIGSILMGVAVENSEPQYYYLIGLVSDGGAFVSPKAPHIFVGVAPYLNWIKYNAV